MELNAWRDEPETFVRFSGKVLYMCCKISSQEGTQWSGFADMCVKHRMHLTPKVRIQLHMMMTMVISHDHKDCN